MNNRNQNSERATEGQQAGVDSQATGAQEKMTQEALRLYQCGPGGPIVTNPADCRPMNGRSSLPNLEITG